MTSKERKKLQFKEADRRFGSPKIRPQDQFPLFMDARRRLNQKTAFSHLSNPFYTKIKSWEPPATIFQPNHVQQKTSPIWVTEANFMQMIDNLKTQFEIAVDLENHLKHSFRGMTCIIQISSTQNDYIIHVPSCHDLICMFLKPLFESENLVKILHGGMNDVLSLQRDFEIFPQAIIDTQYIYNYVNNIDDKGFAISLKDLIKTHLSPRFVDDSDNCSQVADWRHNPLPEAMMRYAQKDSALLLLVWQKLKVQMRSKIWKDDPTNPFIRSNLYNAKCYKFPAQNSPLKDALKLGISDKLIPKFVEIHKWRLKKAIFHDESPSEIINTTEIVKIATSLPTSLKDLANLFYNKKIPRFLRGSEDEILAILHPEIQNPYAELLPPNADTVEEYWEFDESFDESGIPIQIPTNEITVAPTHQIMEISPQPTESSHIESTKLLVPYFPPSSTGTRETTCPHYLPTHYKKWTSRPNDDQRQPRDSTRNPLAKRYQNRRLNTTSVKGSNSKNCKLVQRPKPRSEGGTYTRPPHLPPDFQDNPANQSRHSQRDASPEPLPSLLASPRSHSIQSSSSVVPGNTSSFVSPALHFIRTFTCILFGSIN